MPVITLRQPDGGWRPYRPGVAEPAGPAPRDEPAGTAPPARRPEGSDDPEGGPGRLARLAGHAFDPGRPGLRALAAVAIAVVVGAAVLAWWSRPQPEPVTPQLSATGAAVVATPTGPAVLVVAVTGLVREPGLVELPPGARVADAIEAAGGLLPEAEIDQLNLARKVSDGELIAVGVDPPPDELAGAASGAATGGPVNLNTATLEQLQGLPGIGPALAQRIIDYRDTHGPFTSVGQLRQVSGIGEVRFAELQELVTV
ncbi:helix-hairpin-helix domain-containing protein [Natronosporangium hydrolyticum]|uniref:Helix-hairpin-helix domain-containing protein n=1 Tax=Natronosporangium hydrolyticum TaxID=2811111 RepID=A0A895YHY0_9ACTN|nr:helix-hairpin-helix domain-containing protein [Natronosporangium hydrolyticum]